MHEIKHDGFRLIVRREGTTVRLFTRRGYDWTDRYPAIVAAAAKLRARSFTLDGEEVVCGLDGIAVFDALHRRRRVSDAILQAFDLLEFNGEDYRPLPLGRRKLRLDQGQEPGQSGDVESPRTFREIEGMTRHFPPPWYAERSGADLIILRSAANIGGQMLFWKSWIDAAQFGLEAQSVIAMRLMKIATGGQDGAAECTRMVLEKIDAGAAANTAGALALVGGKSVEAATKLAMIPIRRRVHANHLRLICG